MAASIEDVARAAGVSIATVSRALRGLPDVAASTRDRVFAAAANLNYIASPFAARLASGKTATVGLVVPFVNRWFFSEVISNVETALRLTGFDLLLYNLGDAEGRSRFFDIMPVRKRVDALLVASLVLDEDEYAALDELHCPIGLLGFDRPGMLSTRIDDVTGARVAVEHLLAKGHRRIGLIGGDADDPMRFTPPLNRREGYRHALLEAGLDADPELEQLGFFTPEGGRDAARALLDLPERPTAIFAESDEMAYGAIHELLMRGLRVPEDVAVIGFDDHSLSALMELSTVRQPVSGQAYDITSRLLARVSDPDADLPPDHAAVLPVDLILRASTEGR